MKKLVLILSLIFLGQLVTFGDGNIKQYPIPSYGAVVKNASAFCESNNFQNQNKNKRQMNVRTTTVSPKYGIFPVTIWLVADQGEETMGPYIINCGETLSVRIDSGTWEAVVVADYPLVVDIWIGDSNPY